MSKFQKGDKVRVKLDNFDKIFRPNLKEGDIGEVVEQDTFSVDNPDIDVLYTVNINGTTHAFFEDQLESEN